MQLSDITEILSGINYTQKDLTTVNKGIALLQARDFDNSGNLKNEIAYINKIDINGKLLLSNGDILFASKGNRNYSVVYKGEFEIATATSSFFIIRVKSDKVIPEYVSWYLNQKPAQEFIKLQRVGSFTPSINKSQVEAIDIPIPAIKIQNEIIAIELLRKKERELTNEITFKKNSLIEYCLIKKIKEINE